MGTQMVSLEVGKTNKALCPSYTTPLPVQVGPLPVILSHSHWLREQPLAVDLKACGPPLQKSETPLTNL